MNVFYDSRPSFVTKYLKATLNRIRESLQSQAASRVRQNLAMSIVKARPQDLVETTTEKPEAHARISSLPADRRFPSQPWQPGYLKHVPWRGILASFGDICCVVASGITLLLSNQQPTSSWKVSPTVLLAIFSTAGNFLLRYAHSQGATISWWTMSLKGSTLRDLHRQWTFGTSLWSSLCSGRHMNILALASMFTTICLLDGPILQRATSVVSGSTSQVVQLKAFIAAKSGNFSTVSGDTAGNLSPEFLQVLTDHEAGTAIKLNVSGCEGTCTGTIHTLGLNGSCPVISNVSNDWAKDFYVEQNWDMTATLLNITFPFFYFWSMEQDSARLLDFEVEYFTLSQHTQSYELGGTSYPTCPGYSITRACSFNIGIVEYPVTIVNQTVSLNSNDTQFPIVSLDSYLRAPAGDWESNGFYDFNRAYGFNDAARWLFSSEMTIRPLEIGTTYGVGSMAWSNQLTGSVSLQDIAATNTSTCSRNLKDPTDGILKSLNDILLRTGVAAAAQSQQPLPVQEVSAQQVKSELLYTSDFRYFFAAAAITVTGVLLVLCTYRSWWLIGRTVTLDPLETAKAFDSTVLEHAGTSNAELEMLLRVIGDRRVKYGVKIEENRGVPATERSPRGKRLCLADSESVRRPIPEDLID